MIHSAILIYALFIGLSGPIIESIDINQLRKDYSKTPENKELTIMWLNKLENINLQKKPTLLGYKGALTMIMAKHVINPYTKLKNFNYGKSMLENSIKNNPYSIELRYLRFSIQVNSPSFLGYSANLVEDRKFIISNISIIDNKYLLNQIVASLKDSGKCTEKELAAIEKKTSKSN